jgi:hypothetical protein
MVKCGGKEWLVHDRGRKKFIYNCCLVGAVQTCRKTGQPRCCVMSAAGRTTMLLEHNASVHVLAVRPARAFAVILQLWGEQS